jgi:hypothetical protein
VAVIDAVWGPRCPTNAKVVDIDANRANQSIYVVMRSYNKVNEIAMGGV